MSLLSLIVFCALLGAVRGRREGGSLSGAAIGAVLAFPLMLAILTATRLVAV